MNQAIIKRLTEIIHENLDNENFGVKELAIAAGMSRSTLHRMLMNYLNKSASRFIREVRLQKAMEMLRQDVATVSEISYKVGFNSPAYFNTCFHHYFGYPPGEVKKRYSGETDYNNKGNIEGTVTEEEQLVSPVRKPVRREPFIRLTVINMLVVMMVLIFLPYFLYISFTKEAVLLKENRLKSGDKSIVVFPFKNLSGNPENQYFADGVQEDILNNLIRIKELRIISPAGLHPSNNSTASDIARELNASFILQGSVQQYEGKVRINTQFIDSRLDKLIWSEKYDNKLANIFKIQSSIAKQVAGELQTVLSSSEIEYIEKIQTKVPEAYTMYLKGRFFWNMHTENELKKSVEYFEMALVADPDYALAYAGMADAYFLQAWWGWLPQEEGYAKSKVFTLRALELNKNLVEAHVTMGALLCCSEHKWTEAQKEFILAIELNQHY
ncbi:MAG TPA: helix-turn-helix domain-containing protein, partial [Prolixibacteraceae bacterium]